MNTESAPSASGDSRPGGALRTRLHDKLLWILVVLIVLAIIARVVARQYYLDHSAFDCFPYCSFEQDLSNNVSGGAPIVAVLLAIAAVARWVQLGRRWSRRV